jgi:hypothetical protein
MMNEGEESCRTLNKIEWQVAKNLLQRFRDIRTYIASCFCRFDLPIAACVPCILTRLLQIAQA